MRILETLARVELTDGLTLAQLITETGSRLPRDATVVADSDSVSRRNRRGPGQPAAPRVMP